MPVLTRDDAEIYYEEFGSGYPILLFAPGGLRSRIEMWHEPPGGPVRPWNDWTKELESRYRAIAMDQRNAGQSHGAIAADHGWHTYAADHLALMDYLGFKRFHTLGGCIGSSFCLKLCEMVPDRVSAAVLQNPIGLHPQFPNYFPESHAAWTTEQLSARPELDAKAIATFGKNMWGPDFVFSVTRDFARRCSVPCLVLPGDDTPHPAVTGAELIELLPKVEHLHRWKGPDHLDEQCDRVIGFLEKHTP